MDARTHRNQQQVTNLAEIFVQGMARIVDIQTAAARVLLQSQGRSAAIFGAPDWTPALNRQSEHFSQLFTTSAEQTVNLIRQTSETVNEVQQQVGHLFEQRTAQVTEEMRNGIEEVARRSEQGLEEMRNTTQEAARQAHRAGANGNGKRHSRGRA